jgi:hypothetical protein
MFGFYPLYPFFPTSYALGRGVVFNPYAFSRPYYYSRSGCCCNSRYDGYFHGFF